MCQLGHNVCNLELTALGLEKNNKGGSIYVTQFHMLSLCGPCSCDCVHVTCAHLVRANAACAHGTRVHLICAHAARVHLICAHGTLVHVVCVSEIELRAARLPGRDLRAGSR